MILLKDFYAKNANRGFEIIGVNLDESAARPNSFLLKTACLGNTCANRAGSTGDWPTNSE